MYKVVKLSEVDTAAAFQLNQYLLGDKDGQWWVVDVTDDSPLGRYNDKHDAESHATTLNEDE